MLKKTSLLAVMVALCTIFTTNAATNYGLPTNIQQCNILHCFDWSCDEIVDELPNIAAAGFGAVQISPLQGNATSNAEWFFAYMPYDFCFRDNGIGTQDQLKNLCTKAHSYGVKIIVDVVANHVNKTAGCHDTWWDSNGRQRWNGGIDYSSRYSITHNQLGDYGDVNSESSEVQARAKNYVLSLKALGVDGIRWDAAKHIALPSESCGFWSTVTSGTGMYNYGELLDNPGGDKYALLKEYASYMTITDSEYSDWVRGQVCNGTVPSGHGSWSQNGVPAGSLIYWGESHDTYGNSDKKTTYIDQAVIDRAWAIGACRNYENSLYLSRPLTTDRNSMRMGQKGSTHFTASHIAAVNHLRNAMAGTADYYSAANGVACITRQGGGACIVVGNGQAKYVSCTNGGGYVPAGSYVDEVTGNTFTVTSSTISGNVGSTGIAVIYRKADTSLATPSKLYILGQVNSQAWAANKGTAMTKSGDTFTATVTVNGAFSFASALGSSTDWTAFNNQGVRYGASGTSDVTLTAGKAATFIKANDPKAFTLSSANLGKEYKITVDFKAQTVTATAVASGGSSTTGYTDVITASSFPGFTSKYNFYTASNTTYATTEAYAYKSSSSIQINLGYALNATKTGVYANAKTGYVVKSVTVEGNYGSKGTMVLNVYGANTEYSSSTNFKTAPGTKLGTLKASSTKFTFADGVAHWALVPTASGAFKITKLTVEYVKGTASTITSTQAEAGLKWSKTSATAEVGKTFTAPTLSNPNGLTVKYSSTSTSVAKISSTGKVTIVGAGSATIIASSAATDSFKAGSATYTLTVTEAQAPVSAPNTDVITAASFPTLKRAYQYVTNTSDYATNVAFAYKNNGIQINTGNAGNTNKAGVYVNAKSGYTVKSVTVDANFGTKGTYILNIFTSGSAYTTSTNFKTASGTKVAALKAGAASFTFAAGVSHFALVPSATGANVIKSITVVYNSKAGAPALVETASVDDLEQTSEAAEAIYYNLQGLRVDNPQSGKVYIRVAGNKAAKVLYRD